MPRRSGARSAFAMRENADSYSPPATARAQFPLSLQSLYLPPARLDINIAEDVRYDAKEELKERATKAQSMGRTVKAFSGGNSNASKR